MERPPRPEAPPGFYSKWNPKKFEYDFICNGRATESEPIEHQPMNLVDLISSPEPAEESVVEEEQPTVVEVSKQDFDELELRVFELEEWKSRIEEYLKFKHGVSPQSFATHQKVVDLVHKHAPKPEPVIIPPIPTREDVKSWVEPMMRYEIDQFNKRQIANRLNAASKIAAESKPKKRGLFG